MRVISGIAKGRKLKDVPGYGTRPITDRVKEALFNILAGEILDSNWWDLFSGTGAVGIEAISRGARFVRFVDRERKAINIIRENIDALGFSSTSEIKMGDAFSLLRSAPDRAFDYIFIAPPQYKELWSKALFILDSNIGWINEDSRVIVQIHPKEYIDIDLVNIGEYDQRKYGSTLLVFYEIKNQ
ncbi:16S rRNA (guanine(966)-N(2))-methyltransferase RsmD [Chloroflexota bacterium]